ncbi:oligosaccharide flippase family protein [Flavobacterium fluviatile]|uniref:oligosaccharide flippase family protein n=1 Tax=Flavobacterium fluviatile TaxID=1862387 RepID=UPI0013D50BA3|nr:oligosaccharide flippase family protein [Flavobacterium fluviatile]
MDLIKQKILNIKTKILNNKSIVSNFSYLTLFQIFSILFPFFTYPYLLRVLGFDIYGKVIFAQAIATNICIFVNFGFNVSGTNNVATSQENSLKLSEIVSSIYSVKFVIWSFCLLIYFALIQIIPFLRADKWLYIVAFFISFNDLLFPIWFFQGIEKMKYITFINLGVRSLFVILVFIFVKNHKDYLVVPLLNAIGAFLGGIVALWVVVKIEKVKLMTQPISTLRKYLVDSFPLFVSSLSVQIYINGNKLLVGSFLGMTEVAIYDMGEKITSIIKIPIAMISQATFPKVSREKNIRFINRLMWSTLVFISFVYIVVFVLADFIVVLLSGTHNLATVDVVRILAFSSIPVVFNYFLGTHRLIPFGYKKTYLINTIISSCFFLLGAFGIIGFDIISIHAIAYLDLLTEIVVCLVNLYSCYRLKLLCGRDADI